MTNKVDHEDKLTALLEILEELRILTQIGQENMFHSDQLIQEIVSLDGSNHWRMDLPLETDDKKRKEAMEVLSAFLEKERNSPSLH